MYDTIIFHSSKKMHANIIQYIEIAGTDNNTVQQPYKMVRVEIKRYLH